MKVAATNEEEEEDDNDDDGIGWINDNNINRYKEQGSSKTEVKNNNIGVAIMSADFAMQVINELWSSINKRLTLPSLFSLECRSVDRYPSRISRRHDDHSCEEIYLRMLRLYDYRQRYDQAILPSLRQPLVAQSLMQLRSEW